MLLLLILISAHFGVDSTGTRVFGFITGFATFTLRRHRVPPEQFVPSPFWQGIELRLRLLNDFLSCSLSGIFSTRTHYEVFLT